MWHLSTGFVLFLALFAQGLNYWSYQNSTDRKAISGRALEIFVGASSLAKFGQIGRDPKFYGYLEDRIGFVADKNLRVDPKLVFETFHSDIRDLPQTFNPAFGEDFELGMCFFVNAIWKLTGNYTIWVVLQAMFLIQALFHWGLFLAGRKLLSTGFGIGVFVVSHFYTPQFSFLVEMRNHWFQSLSYLCALLALTFPFRWKLHGPLSFLAGFSALCRTTSVLLFLSYPAIQSFVKKNLIPSMLLLAGIYIGTYAFFEKRLHHYGMPYTRHSFWFPVLVGMAESGLFPSEEDGYGFALGAEHQPPLVLYSDEWNALARKTVTDWVVQNPSRVLKMYANRVAKVLLNTGDEWEKVNRFRNYFFIRIFAPIGFLGWVWLCLFWILRKDFWKIAAVTIPGAYYLLTTVAIIAKNQYYYFPWHFTYFFGWGFLFYRLSNLFSQWAGPAVTRLKHLKR